MPLFEFQSMEKGVSHDFMHTGSRMDLIKKYKAVKIHPVITFRVETKTDATEAGISGIAKTQKFSFLHQLVKKAEKIELFYMHIMRMLKGFQLTM